MTVETKRTPSETATIVAKAVAVIRKGSKKGINNELIKQTCEKMNISENHIRNVGGWVEPVNKMKLQLRAENELGVPFSRITYMNRSALTPEFFKKAEKGNGYLFMKSSRSIAGGSTLPPVETVTITNLVE